MGLPAFDTLGISEKFEQVGFAKDQAKAIIEAIASSRSNPEAISQAEFREHKTKAKANIEKSRI